MALFARADLLCTRGEARYQNYRTVVKSLLIGRSQGVVLNRSTCSQLVISPIIAVLDLETIYHADARYNGCSCYVHLDFLEACLVDPIVQSSES